MLYEEYLSRCLTRRELSRTERLGQAYMNVLEVVRPDLADQIRGTMRDPFYDDGLYRSFMEWVELNW